MKVILDMSPAVQRKAGLGRYAEELACGLVALNSGDDLRIFYTDPMRRVPGPPLDRLPRKSIAWSNKPWRMSALLSWYCRLPMDSLVGSADVFHATEHLLPRLSKMRSVVTLHDLAFLRLPETHLPMNRWFLKRMMPFFLRKADAVIAISEFTKNDAIRSYGLDESRMHVIPEGVNARFRPVNHHPTLAEVRRRCGLPEKFILFVSTIEPRKNLVTLWDAYRVLRSEGRTEALVVVGRKGWLAEETFRHLHQVGLENDVVFPGVVAESDLAAIYSLADCFAFPSLFEGFGLPPLEAMACGCPVVCSDSSSLPEVCGDAAILVSPTDAGSLAGALRRVLDDASLRQTLREKGLRRAALFTWEIAARRTLEIYHAVAANSGSGQST